MNEKKNTKNRTTYFNVKSDNEISFIHNIHLTRRSFVTRELHFNIKLNLLFVYLKVIQSIYDSMVQ